MYDVDTPLQPERIENNFPEQNYDVIKTITVVMINLFIVFVFLKYGLIYYVPLVINNRSLQSISSYQKFKIAWTKLQHVLVLRM